MSPSAEPQGAQSGQLLSPEQLKAKLSLYVGSLPSTVIEDLYQTLKPMALNETKVDEIIERTVKSYTGQESSSRMEELVDKMNNLEDTLVRALKNIEARQVHSALEQETAEVRQAPEPPQSVQVERQPETLPEPGYNVPFAPNVETRRAPTFEDSKQKKKGKQPQLPQFEPAPEEDDSSLFGLDSSFSTPGHRILLPDIPDSAIANAVVLKWVEFLLETVGHQNIPEVLDYYVDIGWISEKVTMKLLAYASGMVAPRGRAKEKLSTKDHLRSLLFIEKLRGKDFDQSKLTRLEREIEYTIEKRIRQG